MLSSPRRPARTILKSALSNRADVDALQAMMAPLIETLTCAGVVGMPVDAPEGHHTPAAALTAVNGPRLHLVPTVCPSATSPPPPALLGRLEAHEPRPSAEDGDR